MSKFFDDTMQGSNSQYDDKKEAFSKLEQLNKKGTVTDDRAELACYMEKKIRNGTWHYNKYVVSFN